MEFPNPPGKQHRHARASLETAHEELRYYVSALWKSENAKQRDKTQIGEAGHELQKKIENATPENASELYKQARQLCLDIEKILSECSKKN